MDTLKITKKHHKHINNPFPSTPTSLPFIQGSLSFNSHTVPSHQIFPVGRNFQLLWSPQNGGYLSVYHNSEPARSLWSTIPGQAFVSAAVAEAEVKESRGSFVVEDKKVHLICDHQTIENIDSYEEGGSSDEDGNPVLVITGCLFSDKRTKESKIYKHLLNKNSVPSACARYMISFEQCNSNQIGFQVRVGEPDIELHRLNESSNAPGRYQKLKRKLRKIRKRKPGSWILVRPRGRVAVSSKEEEHVELKVPEKVDFNRICITYSSEVDERFFGFGEQFSHMDFKGKRVPILVQEQGIGRGDQPITFAANLVSYRSAGDSTTTYAPSPFYMTSNMRSLYLEGYDYSVFDLTRRDRVHLQIHSNSVQGRILHGNSPAQLIEHFTETIGRPPQLPNWIISGAVVGMQGGTQAVRRVLDELKAYKVPVSAFWLQDWVGQRETIVGSQLWWNWEVDATRYEGWQKLIEDLSSQHIKVMTYCNPCLAPTDEKPNKSKNHFEEAKKLDILVKDKQGNSYMVPNTAFDVGMLDLTHPYAASWFKQVLEEMVNDGVRGWMADFGEGLPLDAVLYSGEDPITAHNRYPELWAKINREFVEEWKTDHVDREGEEDLVFFMRAGFRDSPKWGMLFWEGDQMVSWQVNDGIKSAVVGLLSGGLSGYALNHSDIGGYCAVNFPIIKYCRSEELLLRWMELNAFTTVFRTHEGNKPSVNSQFYSNERTLSHFGRCAKLYKAWYFYRVQLVKEATRKGLPVCRHLFLHYPNDKHVQSLTYQQFLVGTEILVVPVLDKGKKKVKAYFPEHETCYWQHVWSGQQYKKPGSHVWIEATIGYPAIFVKVGSNVGETFIKNLRNLGFL